MQECEAVAEEDAIRQGDVFVSRDRGEGPPEVLVVVTADCDFAQKKVGSHTVALPALPSVAYASRQWKLKKLGSLELRIREKRRELMSTIVGRKFEAMRVDLETSDEWFKTKSVDDIVTEISAQDQEGEKLRKFGEACERIRSLSDESVSLQNAIAAYYDILEHIDVGLSVPNKKNRKADLERMLSEERIDFFYLNQIAGQDALGWHVDLRDIRLLPLSDLTSERRIWLAGDCQYLRKGRLKDVYKYALTQKFGSLFSRIGLPEVHEQWKPDVTSDLSAAAFADGGADE